MLAKHFGAGEGSGARVPDLATHEPEPGCARASDHGIVTCHTACHMLLSRRQQYRWSYNEVNTVMKIVYAACMIAALITGHESRALASEKISLKGQTFEISDKAAATLLCRAEWKKQTDATVLEYGSQYFMKICKRKLIGGDVTPAAATRR